MKVLVTGGTGVVGTAAVSALRARGWTVRLLSRHANTDSRQWPDAVEGFEADIGDAASLRGCARGCDAVLHVVGIVAESPPELTFERINVEGTRLVVEEAARAGVPRLVFVSSLGAERGESDYHRSKRAAEAQIRRFPGNWTVVRVGNVYGPGDEVLSLLLQMVRSLPAIPVVDDGSQPFQPIWHEDVGRALALLVERADLGGRTLELAGDDVTSMGDLLERLARVTGRRPLPFPVPSPAATMGARLASWLGMDLPITESHLQMLQEGNVVSDPAGNALTTVLGLAPTPLDEGLGRLADALPEQLPGEGVGPMQRKRFWAHILEPRHGAEALCARFREHFSELFPIEVGSEPGAPDRLEEGATLTMALPVRGTIQVRCEELTDRSVTLATLAGHPLAGIVRFLFDPAQEGVLFEIRIYAQAASYLDMLAMATVGDGMQSRTWQTTVERVIALSGGIAPAGVRSATEELEPDDAAGLERWLEDVILDRRRKERVG